METSKSWEKAYAKGVLAWRGSSGFNPGLPSGAKLLELGCGNGKNLSALSGFGLQVYAIDVSPTAIGLCRANPVLANERIHYSLMDCRKLGFADGFFDAVAAFHVIDHLALDGRKAAVAEAVRVLAPGGKLFFKAFGTRDFRIKKGTLVEENTLKRKNGIITHYYSKNEVIELFSPLKLLAFDSQEWTVNYGGVAYPRQELYAVFLKP